MTAKTNYKPTYADELELSHHFVRVLEQRLAGRDSVRRTNIHPLDWCHLGVVGPSKVTHIPVEMDSVTVDAEPDPDAAATAAAAGAKLSTSSAAPKASPAAPSNDGEPAAEAPPVIEKSEDRDGPRRPPSALGFEAMLAPAASGRIVLEVDASFTVFTKHLPSWAEQTSVLEGSASTGPLAEVVQRRRLEVKGLRFELPATGGKALDGGRVQAVIEGALQDAFGSPDAERLWATRPKVDKASYLKDEKTFNEFLTNLAQARDVERWELHGSVEVRAAVRPDGLLRIGCYFRNDTPETPPLTKGKGLKDAFKVFGDVSVTARILEGALHPIEILPVPQDYQYDRRVWAVGHNTSVVASENSSEIRTAALAVYEQPRIMTRDAVKARFSELAQDPFQTLTAIYEEMVVYARHWKSDVLAANSLKLDPHAYEQCTKDYAGFEDEIKRFASGVAALRVDERLLAAFKSMNRVMGRLALGYDAWRLFQLVFIVTQLPGLAVRAGVVAGQFPPGQSRTWGDALDWGDVLWFRTGGGKTEAYLGLACCAMLFDRLRGKAFGVTAWLRFPLRMLSIQQLQRAMRVIWETEQERKALLGADAGATDGIRLGYFVGSTTTPNSLSREDLEKKYSSEESLEKLRVVPDCPACGEPGSVRVTTDLAAVRFRHVCTKCSVELPLDVSDDEVYRRLPTLIVGTIDKMATVGQQPKFGMVWGGAKWRCPVHGYAYGEWCSAYGCKEEKKTRIPVKAHDPAPALHIQDELHLLQEELGAFAGHYETLIRFCEASASGRPSKVIAATATIEGFEHQVCHLYGVKHARRFPGRGYDKARSFYAEPEQDSAGEDKTARIFVAFKSPSMPPADASAYCTEILHGEIARLYASPHLALAFLKDAKVDADVHELLTYYTTTLNYVGSLQKGSRVKQALDDVASKLRQSAARDLKVEFHSSRSSSAEVADLVHRVESPPKWEDTGFLDALIATNMISHGVDLERVNLMTMDGVPEETAEYIQASSRSGRRHVGLVVVVLAGFSLRASSIYHRFLEYHAHLDRMVSPVPVNRFAKYAAQRTLPGVALGLVYGVHAVQTGKSGLNKRKEAETLLNDLGPKFFSEVQQAYSLGGAVYDPRLEQALKDTLKEQVDKVAMSIRNSFEPYVKDAVKPAPMTSLRDVEAGVVFWPDAADGRLLLFVQKSRE